MDSTLKRSRLTLYLIFLHTLSLLFSGQPKNVSSTARQIDAKDVVKEFGISPLGFPLDYSRLSDFYEEIGSMPHPSVM